MLHETHFPMLRKLRNYFFSGLLVVVPIAITIWIFWAIFNILDHWYRQMAQHYGFYDALLSRGYFIPKYGIGFILTLSLITFIGFMTQLYLGKKIIEIIDFIFLTIPGVSTIYNGLKQVSESVMGTHRRIFESVGLIEFPRPGVYILAFIVGPDPQLFSPQLGKDMVYVFVAKTPNPTSGFFLILPKEDIIPLDLTVEEAMKMVISGGMVTPRGRSVITDQPVGNPFV